VRQVLRHAGPRLERRDIVSAGYYFSFSCPPDKKVTYFCNNLQTMPSSEKAEKKCKKKKNGGGWSSSAI
jgi:hypothetical protein